ncbi:WD repeat-containing protein-like protein [Mollisia scopiformis]|uniref:WD repeat-containing protein-like protein n=1 Tax=Mollisia scopiformis TaxID=149040 RepID=A0A194XQX4_MOLSC|nr:WD repeat-containing protein-like protein [Mollisia scopiformis]KUJ22132.1 WD repeat-containing protein-like protein [Mollisia scopiformis]
MSSTPMQIDSPMGNGITGRANGVQATAMLSEMIPIFRPTKHWRRDTPIPGSRNTAPTTILSLDFDDEGGLLLTSESDSSMQIYNVKEGKQHKTCLSHKYGVAKAIFGHATGCIIHSSTKLNNTIRYLSTHDNSYLRYFEGHTEAVTCLALHPGQDTFLSCSYDNTLRIWDSATKNVAGRLDLHGAYLTAWDPSGYVFAVASPTAAAIVLYDFRNFDKAPFASFDMLPYSGEMGEGMSRGWNKLEFSNDGKHLLLGTTGNSHFLLDAFDGHVKASLRKDRGSVRRLGPGEHNPENMDPMSSDYLFPSTGDCCFSPDGRYVLSGTRQRNVLVWETLGGSTETSRSVVPAHELDYAGDTALMAFNPRYNMFATADKEVVFWLPDQSLA